MSDLLTVTLCAKERRKKSERVKSEKANSQPCQKSMRCTPVKVPIFKKFKGQDTKNTEYL